MMLFQVREHLIEVSPAAHLGRFDVFELPHNCKTLAYRMLLQKAHLGRDAESFRVLILAGYSHVKHNASGLKRRRAPSRSLQNQSSRRHGTSTLPNSDSSFL